ncbi:MAG: hypothetical protein IPL35_09400 [Sphingobacteriales bacterium]|nr:hypothetical protein [Sphingobacteriales bacterium]
MDKRILIGLVSGLILGAIEMFAFNGGTSLLIIPALLGGLIGFLFTTSIPLNRYVLGAIAGAVFFIAIAAQSGLWLDDIVTGAITGLLITFITGLVGSKLK